MRLAKMRTKLFSFNIFPLLILTISFSKVSPAQTAAIDASQTYQTIDGWGGQTYEFATSLTGSNADLFFSPTVGIGLEIVRTANSFDGSIPDSVTLQSAVARGVQVELSLQSPPCSLKHSSVDLGENCTSGSSSGVGPSAWNDGTAGSSGMCFANSLSIDGSGGAFDQYGTYIVNLIKTFQGSPNSIPITFLDVQNEANTPNSSLGACTWSSGSQFQDFIKNYLGPKLSAAGLSSVKVMLGPAYNWFGTDFVSACLNDSACSAYVSIASGHGYGYPYPPAAYSLGLSGGRHTWLSETGSQSMTYDGSMSDALTWAQNMHSFLTVANVSGIEWWELAYSTNPTYGLPNGGLTDGSFNPAKRFWAEGNWSRFVRSGWVRIGATASPQTGVFVTAFENPSSKAFAVVAVNSNAKSVSQQFVLNSLSASSVTPYVTDPSNDLAAQPSASVSSGSFTSTLSASSVTTFVALAGGPTPPSNLTGTVVQ